MALEPKSLNRFIDTPRDKPKGERTEHGNLERPGARAHPRARCWGTDTITVWRSR